MTRSLIPLALIAWIATIYLITTGIHRRIGWGRRCAKCAYPHPDPMPYPITCPECGRTLRPNSHTDIIMGKNVSSTPRIITGVLALIAMTALIAST
ncbi:MAG: hypothetical protein AAGA55_06670 [Planctomycetota bacterium]